MLVVLLDSYVPNYHSATLYELRVDAAAFEVCLKKTNRSLSKHLVTIFANISVKSHRLYISLSGFLHCIRCRYLGILLCGAGICLCTMVICYLTIGPKALFRMGLAILSSRKCIFFANGKLLF